jgi:hypothetical protein
MVGEWQSDTAIEAAERQARRLRWLRFFIGIDIILLVMVMGLLAGAYRQHSGPCAGEAAPSFQGAK